MVIEDPHALVIGIARYQRVSPLHATQDAQDVAAVLQDPRYCGYPPAAVQVLLDDAATRETIYGALDALARATTEASTVFVYYSGHGAHGGDAYYLLPVEAEAATRDNLARTAISNTELSARLRAIPAGRLTVVLDCCRAADMAEPTLSEVVAPLAQGRGRAILAASRASDAAHTLPGRRDSAMTESLLEGLRGAAPGVGGVIRICDLFQYVQQQVALAALEQHPVFKAELEENYPIAPLQGGAPAPLVLPPPPDDFTYDAFVSYCEADPVDHAWVVGTLVPTLERLGLRLCLGERDFRLGAPVIGEEEDAVLHSRYTIAVFTPAYLEGVFSCYQEQLAAQNAKESDEPRLIPLARRACQIPLHMRVTAALDVSREPEVPSALLRLGQALRQAARPRLNAGMTRG